MWKEARGPVFTIMVVGMLMLLFVSWGATRIVAAIGFERSCEGYLKRAADANTIQLATEQLEIAIAYLEERGMTEGYTSIVYQTPDEDVGYWFQNLKAALEELQNSDPNASQLEKSNLLMKLRETILDDTRRGVSVTVPRGISIFPYNEELCVFAVIVSIPFLIGYFKIRKR